MKDERGLYYHPFPANKQVRMYVKIVGNEIAFRMRNDADPQLWHEHGWAPYSAIIEAAKMHQGKSFDPMRAYDIDAAAELLERR